VTDEPPTPHDVIKQAIETFEPMVTNWTLTFETSQLEDDGDLSGAWGMLLSDPPSIAHVGLLEMGAQQAKRQYLMEAE